MTSVKAVKLLNLCEKQTSFPAVCKHPQYTAYLSVFTLIAVPVSAHVISVAWVCAIFYLDPKWSVSFAQRLPFDVSLFISSTHLM